MAAVSLCMAGVSEPLRAYTPFVMDGLASEYKKDSYGKYAYAPSTVFYNGAYHQFYCSNGQGSDNYFNLNNNKNLYKSWDHIRYRSSKDGINWSAPRVVMTVHHNGYGQCACDPSVVYSDDDKYWYMLYTGNVPEPNYKTVVFLARSEYIQGPYFKYTDYNGGSWENDNGMKGNPMIMLGEINPKEYGVGQQAVVKVANDENGRKGNFRVWFRDGDNRIRYADVAKLTDLKNKNAKEYKEAEFYDKESKSGKKSFAGSYFIGDVKMNVKKSLDLGKPYFEMWAHNQYFAFEHFVTKFGSDNGYEWTIENTNDLEIGNIENGRYRYSYTHNIGVSGDMYGRVRDGQYIVSFAAPSPGWSADASKVLNACIDADYKDYMEPYGIACNYKLTKKEGFNIEEHRHGEDMGGKWSMWQVLVGGKWVENVVSYPSDGMVFPEDKNINKSAVIDYFTGDFDGDGVSDLGAVDRSSHKWYLYSIRKNCYMNWKGGCKSKGYGEILINDTYDANGKIVADGMTSDFEIISGDYDGDGKTDIGAVDKRLGRWYIYSSEKRRKGVYSSLAEPNCIPWGWKWGGMDASFKIVVGDYDGDGKADRAIYNAPNWYIISSMALESGVASGFYDVKAVTYFPFGWSWPGMTSSHVAVPGDFDGDGITDRAIYGNRQWFSLSSRLGETPLERVYYGTNFYRYYYQNKYSFIVPKMKMWEFYFGEEGEPYVGDFDGDGVSDFVRVSKSKDGWEWSFYSSVNPEIVRKTWSKMKDVVDTAILVGDFDGDYVSDMALVNRKNRTFYVKSSRNGDADGISYKRLSVPASVHALAKSVSENPIEEPKVAAVEPKVHSVNISAAGRNVSVTNVQNGDKIAVFNVLGKKVYSSVSNGNPVNFELPSYGKFVVRAGIVSKMIVVK